MFHPPLVNSPTQFWDSTDHEDYSRARGLENIISACNVQTKVESQNVEARLSYRFVGNYRFADVQYRNYQALAKRNTKMGNGSTILLLVKKGQVEIETGDREYLLNAGDYVMANELCSVRVQTVGLVN